LDGAIPSSAYRLMWKKQPRFPLLTVLLVSLVLHVRFDQFQASRAEIKRVGLRRERLQLPPCLLRHEDGPFFLGSFL
jgi:hypothetical protein